MPKTEEQKAKQREYNRAYYLKHQEEKKAKARERLAALPEEERKAYAASYREAHKDELKTYNRSYYEEHADEIRERAKREIKARREAETPEQKAERLRKNRERYARKKAQAAPPPEALPPPPEEFEPLELTPPPTPAVRPMRGASPPPPPPPPTAAVRAIGAGAGAEPPKPPPTKAVRATKVEKLAAKLTAFKLDYIQKLEENASSPKPKWLMNYFEKQGRKKLGLTPEDFRAFKEEHARQYAPQIAARAQKKEEEAARLKAFAAQTGYAGGTWGAAFAIAGGRLGVGMRTMADEALAERKRRKREEKEAAKMNRALGLK